MMMKLRHILFLLLAPYALLKISAQVEERAPIIDSIEVAIDSLEAIIQQGQIDSFAIDTAALFAISDDIMLQKSIKRDLSKFRPEPIRAMWLALVIPGAGQFYNRKYWKLPIVYGGFLGCVYALTWNSKMLQDYSQAYLDITDSDPNTKSYEKMLPPRYSIVGKEARFQGIFRSKKDTFRRYRDLSLHIQPTFIETERIDIHRRRTTPGIQCVLNF